MRRFLSAVFNYITGLRSGLHSTRAAAPKGVAVPGKFQEYKASAEQGDAEAQFNLGFCYDDDDEGIFQMVRYFLEWLNGSPRFDKSWA